MGCSIALRCIYAAASSSRGRNTAFDQRTDQLVLSCRPLLSRRTVRDQGDALNTRFSEASAMAFNHW